MGEVTKTYTNVSVSIIYEAETSIYMSSDVKYMGWRYKTTGYEYIAFDLSDIPAGSTITKVSFNYSAQEFNGGRTGARIRANNQDATNTNILDYLSTLSAFGDFGIQFRAYQDSYSYSIQGSAQEPYDWTTQRRVQYFSEISLTITYTEPENSTVSYGADGTWQKCKNYYGADSSWQECKAFYGVDGTWKEVK